MCRYVALALAASALALPASAADHKFDADACARAVAPYLDEQTFAVLHVDLTAVDLDAVAHKAGADPALVPSPEVAAALKTLTDAGARDLYLVASLADWPERPFFAVVPLEKDAKVQALTDALDKADQSDFIRSLAESSGQYHPSNPYHFTQVGDALVGGEDATLQRLRDLKPAVAPDLARAFAAADGRLAQLALIPPKDAAKIIEGATPTLPAAVGGGPIQVLTRGFRWAAVGLDAPKLKLSVTIQAADADAAKALLDLLDKTYAAVGKSKQVREVLPTYNQLTELLTPKIAGDRLVLTLEEPALTPALRPLFVTADEAAARRESSKRLRQLVIAMHDYQDFHGAFPAAAIADKKGGPPVSWRVRLLPFLGEDKLYKEYHLDEPWDSEHNKKLIARMPAVFRSSVKGAAAMPAVFRSSAKDAAEGKTTYLAPVGPATMFPPDRGVSILEVTDGTSLTIFLVDADDDHAVVWTKPEDLDYDPKEPRKGLGGRLPGGFLAAFVDGSVHFLPTSIDKTTLQGLFTRNGGEVVTLP